MSLFVVDVESDGPIVGENSMICFGAVLVKDMNQTFYGQTAPISDKFKPETLAISGFSREEHMLFPKPEIIMPEFSDWVERINEKGTKPTLITDNPGYDFCWINYYLLKYVGKNVFGWSARRIGDLYGGLVGKANARWKQFRKNKHTHNPVDDAKGNAEVIHYLKDNLGLKIKI